MLGTGRSSDELALAIVIAAVSFLALVIGALVPKSLALRYSEGVSLAVGRPLVLLGWAMRPLVWLLLGTSNLLLRLFGDRTTFTEARISPEELQQMVEEAAQSGTIDPRVGDVVSRVFDFEDLRVSSVMIPKREIVAVRRHAPSDEVLQLIAEHGHSRIPIYEDSLDRIVGYVVAQDVVALAVERQLLVLEDILRPAYYVPESMQVMDCLRGMQKRRMQMAIVLDEHGGVAGLVTIEDLIEELVGDIVSEGEEIDDDIKIEPDGAAQVVGTTPIREVNRRLEVDLPEHAGFESIGGLCIHLAGWIPTQGATLTAGDGTVLEVLDANPRRVERVRVRPPPKPVSDDGDGPPPGDRDDGDDDDGAARRGRAGEG
jgi:putative hemolysin